MNRIILGAATLAGTSALALSMVAAPAFAAEPASVPKPTETLTQNVTVAEFVSSGVKAEFTGLTPGGTYQLVFATPNSGGPVGDPAKADAAGRLSSEYVAPNPGKKYLATLVGDAYTLSLYGDAGAVVSKTFGVKYGSKLHWNSSHRASGKLTVTTTAKRWSPTAEKYVPWRHASVKLQEKTGSSWKTVKTVRSNAKGVAKTTVKAGKHAWRAVVSSSATVWTSRTATHKK